MPKKPDDEPEWLTRKTRIDGRLRALGWDIVPATKPAPAHPCAVNEYPTANGPADYALVVGGRVLGTVEAKKLSLGPQNVLVQAQRYAEGATATPFQFGPYRVPFLYSTNGVVIWFQDVRSPLDRSWKVADYPTPAALEERLARDIDADLQKQQAPRGPDLDGEARGRRRGPAPDRRRARRAGRGEADRRQGAGRRRGPVACPHPPLRVHAATRYAVTDPALIPRYHGSDRG